MLLRYITVLFFMGALSIQDIRHKKIPVFLLVLFGAGGGVFLLLNSTGMFESGVTWCQGLAGMLPGAVLLAAARMSEGRIGSGDGYAAAALGLYTGAGQILNCLLYGSVICAAAAIGLLTVGNKKKTDRIAFLPFLTAGYLLTILLHG